VICIQNHDQIGKTRQGERLIALASTAQRPAAAALLLLAPHTPLLFMAKSMTSRAFQFFTSYGDPQIARAVRKGRREESSSSAETMCLIRRTLHVRRSR